VSEVGAEPFHPEPDAFMTNVDAALVEHTHYIAKREWKPNIHQRAKLVDLGRSLEVAKWVSSHLPRLNAGFGDLKSGSADNAVLTPRRWRSSYPTFRWLDLQLFEHSHRV